ncbi:hypothetical protein OQ630_16980, partial [Klebsiella pneumoniae]|uniref:hypothetical protein n=1 Tax=Klebsiella pneumoniae TaxID=573 RepID=UPI001C6F7C27
SVRGMIPVAAAISRMKVFAKPDAAVSLSVPLAASTSGTRVVLRVPVLLTPPDNINALSG